MVLSTLVSVIPERYGHVKLNIQFDLIIGWTCNVLIDSIDQQTNTH